jgi:valyl-tRNA synthetase
MFRYSLRALSGASAVAHSAVALRVAAPMPSLLSRVRWSMPCPSPSAHVHTRDFRTSAACLAPPSKASLSQPLANVYDPAAVEREWYEWWERSGLFRADQHAPRRSPSASSGPPVDASDRFSMVLPPPNVTGALHIGHALTVSVQDVLARWARMSGRAVVWVPGLDHAGIATQVVVEKRIALPPLSTTRHALGRQRFVDEVWKWKQTFGDRITQQLVRRPHTTRVAVSAAD